MIKRLATCAIILLAAAAAGAQSVPAMINYQGHLSGADGSALPTGDYSLAFRIWDDPAAGTLIWGPLHFDVPAGQAASLTTGHKYQVPVVQGYFNVMIGEVDVDGDSILSAFAGAGRYMEITVDEAGGGSPILPRQQVLAAPFAIRALEGGEIGDIVMSSLSETQFNAQRPGGNWVLCDGRDVTGTEYAAVAGATTVPDLRGRFPIAAGQGVGLTDRALRVTGGEEMHTLTLGEMPQHQHWYVHYWDEDPVEDKFGTENGDGIGRHEWDKTDEGNFGGAVPTSPDPPPGGDLPHNNMPPFSVVNFFIRVN